jgi:hypothetical protein
VLYGNGLWDGGGSFSSRLLTALFPTFLIGTAEFVRRLRGIGAALLVLCTCFSVWIGLAQYNGYYHASGADSITQIVDNFKSFLGPEVNRYHRPPPYDSIQNLGRQLGDRALGRWQFYWRLVT